jgi:hypothetical protein
MEDSLVSFMHFLEFIKDGEDKIISELTGDAA